MTQLQEYTSFDPRLLQLEANYGSCLEGLTREDKLALRAVLSRYLYYKIFIEQYSITDAITDTMLNLDEPVCNIMRRLKGISDNNIEGLVRFVSDHQNCTN